MDQGTPWGLIIVSGQFNVLPLISMTAEVHIFDIAASISLVQEYKNNTSDAVEVCYLFPIPDRSVVNSFCLVKEDGRKIVGEIEERVSGKDRYEVAIREGKSASLMQGLGPDVFQISVGNIPPNETVKVELGYITELAEAESNDSIRFHLPSRLGSRYGFISAIPDTSFLFKRLEVRVFIDLIKPIQEVTCPTNSISVEISGTSATATYASFDPLTSDFVLAISSIGLASPRGFFERFQSSAALMLTLVPPFQLPLILRQEFIFLIDRSGSMFGERIETVRDALIVMLRSLPSNGTIFNLISFGSTCTALWEGGSRVYDQGNLDIATAHVDSMDANMGGTELRAALKFACETRSTDRPTSIFVLTDGQVHDLENTLSLITRETIQADVEAPLRFFVLGIGNTVSTSMCNGIARSGNGIAQYIVNPTEGLTRKSAKLLTGAMSPRPIKISLSISSEGNGADNLESVAASSKDASASSSGPPVLHSTSNLYPNSRFHAYILLPSPIVVPKSVVLHVQLQPGEHFSVDIPVAERVINEGSNHLIHPLVAQKLIRDLDASDPGARAMSVTLAKAHNILSESTCFISVDESGPQQQVKMKRCEPPGRGGIRYKMNQASTIIPQRNQRSQPSESADIARQNQSFQLSAIARHQSFNGSFRPSVLPLCPLKNDAVSLPASVMNIENDELRDQIRASLFVIRFLKTKMNDEKEAWKMMYEKAVTFLRGTSLVSQGELDEFLQTFA